MKKEMLEKYLPTQADIREKGAKVTEKKKEVKEKGLIGPTTYSTENTSYRPLQIKLK